jgi:hypothetical protein
MALCESAAGEIRMSILNRLENGKKIEDWTKEL